MKNERAPESVVILTYERAFSPIFITAALSVVVLIVALGWQMTRTSSAENPPSLAGGAPSLIGAPASAGTTTPTENATSSDPITSLGAAIVQNLQGAYLQMQQDGTYSTSTAESAGRSLASYINITLSYPTFTASQIKTDADTSYSRMLRYRADLRASLSPLLNNTQPEYEIFAYYVDTKDSKYLAKLRGVAGDYRAAASSTALVVAPRDALDVHIGMLNAMEEFAATLEGLAAHAQDPFASAALLQNYTQAESDVRTAFNALIVYEKGKLP